MPMIRSRRPFAALLAIVAIVFAQMSVSAHACTAPGEPAGDEVAAPHTQCGGMGEADEASVNVNVCAGHCQYGHATFDNTPPTPAAIDTAGPSLRIDLPAPASSADSRPAWRFAPAAAPPPPAILFGVLRI